MVSDNVNRTATDVKNGLASALRQFEGGSLFHNAIGLFQTLGYNTERQNPLDQPTYAGLVAEYPQLAERMNADKARAADWKQVHLLFQLTEAEMNRQMGLFDAGRVDNTIIESYLFFAVELSETTYTRTQLAQITREFNRIFPMPVLVLFKTGNLLTLSIIDRRLHKRDDSRDVLEKVTLIKDIALTKTHPGHLGILDDLSFGELYRQHKFDSFVALHRAWQKTLIFYKR